MKIGYLYYKFYPVDGGVAIHGYHLAKELTNLGYKLYKLNGDKDPYTHKFSNPVWGFLWMLRNCHLFYVRMDYFLKPRNLLIILALICRKKIIVELNSPSDELYLYGRRMAYIAKVDRIVSYILKRVDAVIVVSDPIKKYCQNELGLDHVTVIENGADQFDFDQNEVNSDIKSDLMKIKKLNSKLLVWSGSANKMQNFHLLNNVIENCKSDIAFLLIIKEEKGKSIPVENAGNVYKFKNLNRVDVEYIISNADAGLAFYTDYSWCRWGFYNSSLKTFEYLSNGLIAISNKSGTEVLNSHPNFKFGENLKEIVSIIEELPSEKLQFQYRSWEDVAKQVSNIIQVSLKT